MKIALFDMDGLLLDTEPITIQAKVEEGKKIGLPITAEMVKHTIGMSQKHVDSYFTSLFGNRYQHEYFKKKRQEYLFDYIAKHGLPIKEGVIPLLTFLKSEGIPMAIVTSSSKEIVMQYQKCHALFSYFDQIITGEEVKEGKPHPDVYLHAAKVMGVQPRDCIVFEDSKNGVISARRAGMTVVMIPDLIQPDDEILSYHPIVMDHLQEAIPYIKEWLLN